jgi:hypothetical protein
MARRSSAVQKIKVFVASPSDVVEERIRLCRVAEKLNRMLERNRLVLQVKRWEVDVPPDMKGRARGSILPVLADCDIFIGIMWKAFGSPTGQSPSGTKEEFEFARDSYKATGRPEIMFYFNDQPYTIRTAKEAKQLLEVMKFRENLKEQGVIGPYCGPEQFQELVEEHLYGKALDLARRPRRRSAERGRQARAKPRVLDPREAFDAMMRWAKEADGAVSAWKRGHRVDAARGEKIVDSLRTAINNVRICYNDVRFAVGIAEPERRTYEAQQSLAALKRLLASDPVLWPGHDGNVADILLLREKGLTSMEIADMTGNSLSYVSQIYRLGQDGHGE